MKDSKAAPLLQLKCNALKRARLADDLNEKLANRPGPLELVESGILLSTDSSLNEMLKDGKIDYPRTSAVINKLGSYNSQDQTEIDTNTDPNLYGFDDSNFSYLNFNGSNQTDNEDSNASSGTAKNVPVSFNSFNFNSLSPKNQQNTEQNNFNLQTSGVPSPGSSTSKFSPCPSPFNQNDQKSKPSNKSKSGKSSSSFNASSGSKTIRPRNNSNTSVNSPGSVSSSSSQTSGSTKKLSQIIFHEYRGPYQKSFKTSISLKSKSGANKNSSNTINQNSSNSQTNTNEIYFDDSNDSMTNNLNSAIMDSDELNPHKIRMKQQKIFLNFSNNSEKMDDSISTNKTPTPFNPNLQGHGIINPSPVPVTDHLALIQQVNTNQTSHNDPQLIQNNHNSCLATDLTVYTLLNILPQTSKFDFM